MASEHQTIGELYVAIRPAMQGFESETQRELDHSHARLHVPVAIDRQQAERAGESAGRSAGNSFSQHFQNISRGALAAVGIAAVGAGLTKFASDATSKFKEAAVAANGLSRVMGGTVEEASRLNFAAHEVGIGSDQLTGAVTKLSKWLGNAKNDLGKFGIEAKDSHGKLLPMAQLLPNIAEKFATMANGPEKTALALQLFGKSGAQLLPFLNKGKDGIIELEKESDKFGNTVSTKGVASLKQYNLAHKELKAAQEGLMISIGQSLMPMLAKLEEFIATHVVPIIEKLGEFFREHVVPIISTFAGILTRDVFPAVSTVFGFISRNKGVFLPIVAGLLAAVAAFKAFMFIKEVIVAVRAFNLVLLANPIGLVIAAIAALAAGLIYAYKHSQTFRNIVKEVFQTIKAIVMPIINGIRDAALWLWKNVLEPLGKFLIGVFKVYWAVMRAEFKLVVDAINGVIDVFKWLWHNVLEPVAGFINKVFVSAWHGVVDAISAVVKAAQTTWSTISDLFTVPINVVLNVVGFFTRIIDDVLSAVGLGRPLGSFEHLHVGGDGGSSGGTADKQALQSGHHALGGLIPGGYGGGDTYSAMLEPGEFVMSKEAVKAYGSEYLSSLNTFGNPRNAKPGRPGYHSLGGLIGDIVHPSRIYNPIISGVKSVAGDVFDAGKWVLDEAQHFLRKGAAAAVDLAYKGALRPILGLLHSSGIAGDLAKGGADSMEKHLTDWIRGKEHNELTVVGGLGKDFKPVPYTGGSNTIGLIETMAQILGSGLAVTSTFRSNAGYHGLNEAVDFSNGPGYGPGSQTPQELAFDLAMARTYGPSLAELIHAQPGAINIKDGRVVDGPSFYGASTMLDHWNHVHVAVSPESIARGGQIKLASHDQGGWLQPGWTLTHNGTGKPERVLTAEQNATRGIQVHIGQVNDPVDVDMVVNRLAFHVKKGMA